jgi:hypothetical protein
MTTPTSPASSFLPVMYAVAATLLFGASSRADTVARILLFVAGLAFLVLAIVGVARMRSGSGHGWRPSRDAEPGSSEDQPGR